MGSKNFKKMIVSFYKIMTYALLLISFILFMSKVNSALVRATRTSVITALSYITTLMIMQGVYGDFDIGYRKSKPVFVTTMISVLISGITSTLIMLFMGMDIYPINSVILEVVVILIILLLFQSVLVWTLAHLGNEIYFKMHKPEKVIILNNDSFVFEKVQNYMINHSKQFEIIGIYNNINYNETLQEKVDIFCCLGFDERTESRLIKYCYRNKMKFIYNVGKTDTLIGQKHTFVIDDVLMVDVSPSSQSCSQLIIKRSIDIIGSLTLLIITLPIFIVTAVSIKMDDSGPIIYSQERLTKNAKVFKIYKFRSMKLNSGSKPASVNDDRITKVGHVIRKLRVDELPQVFNILKGDISLVGPRPESLEHAKKIIIEEPDFDLRLSVKAGLTGYAQIFGKYNTTPKMKLILDLKYIENFSILEDLKLILQTFIVFVKSDSSEGFNDCDV